MKDFEKVTTAIPAIERPQDEVRFRDFHIRAQEVREMEEVDILDEDGEVTGTREEPTGVMLTEIKSVELMLIACKKSDDTVTEIAVPLVLNGDNAKTFLAPFETALKTAISEWMASLKTDAE